MKISWKNLERAVKAARGKNVPELDMEIPASIQDAMQDALKFGVSAAIALIDDAADELRETLTDVPLNIFNAIVDEIKKKIQDVAGNG